MTVPSILAIASWLVPDDEIGATLIGDLEEAHAEWQSRFGAGKARRLLWRELLLSIPGLGWSAVIERGPLTCLVRSLPVLVLGALIFYLPISLIGATSVGSTAGLVIGLVVEFGAAVVSGWTVAALAGAAPRQHALGLGLALASLGPLLMSTGAVVIPLWWWLCFQITVVGAAGYGGGRYWRSHRNPAWT